MTVLFLLYFFSQFRFFFFFGDQVCLFSFGNKVGDWFFFLCDCSLSFSSRFFSFCSLFICSYCVVKFGLKCAVNYLYVSLSLNDLVSVWTHLCNLSLRHWPEETWTPSLYTRTCSLLWCMCVCMSMCSTCSCTSYHLIFFLALNWMLKCHFRSDKMISTIVVG